MPEPLRLAGLLLVAGALLVDLGRFQPTAAEPVRAGAPTELSSAATRPDAAR